MRKNNPPMRPKPGAWRQVAVEAETCFEEAVTLPGEVDKEIAVVLPEGVTPSVPEVGEACGYCITPAMAYVPDQKWGQPYDPEDGLHRGTLFPELDLPFMGEGGKKK